MDPNTAEAAAHCKGGWESGPAVSSSRRSGFAELPVQRPPGVPPG